MVEISEASGVPVETLRKIETGRIATPAFFTVAALAKALELDLVELAVDDVPRQVLERVDHAADRAWVGGSLAARSAG